VASALSFAQVEWDMSQDLTTFEKASIVGDLTPSQREILVQAQANFQSEIERFRKLKEVIDVNVAPVWAQLLEERAHQLAEANAATMSVQPDVTATSRYSGGQTTFGYTQ
jgi:hypothetical protein